MIALVALAGCSHPAQKAATLPGNNNAAAKGPNVAQTPTAATGKTTQLQVYVPCAFEPASVKIKPLFEKSHPGVKIVTVVENVDVLAPKIMKGDKPDVFMCIGDKEVKDMAAKGLVAYQQPMCFTTLVLVVPLANPAKVSKLSDLTKPAVKTIAIGTPDTSVGFYAQKVLEDNHVWDKIQGKLTRPRFPVEMLRLPIAGKVQASIAFGACFRAKEGEEKAQSSKLKLISNFQDKYCLTIACPAAVIKGCQHPDVAKQFVDFLQTDQCQSIFDKAGFMKLSDPKCYTTRSDQTPATKPATKAGSKTSAKVDPKHGAKATAKAKHSSKTAKATVKHGAKAAAKASTVPTGGS